MARRGSPYSQYTDQGIHDRLGWVRPGVRRFPSPLSLLEDRRLFHPMADLRPPRSFVLRPRLVARAASRIERKLNPFSAIRFEVPRFVAICVRRKERKEVIHAKRLTRKGAGGSKSRNWWSNVFCK